MAKDVESTNSTIYHYVIWRYIGQLVKKPPTSLSPYIWWWILRVNLYRDCWVIELDEWIDRWTFCENGQTSDKNIDKDENHRQRLELHFAVFLLLQLPSHFKKHIDVMKADVIIIKIEEQMNSLNWWIL